MLTLLYLTVKRGDKVKWIWWRPLSYVNKTSRAIWIDNCYTHNEMLVESSLLAMTGWFTTLDELCKWVFVEV